MRRALLLALALAGCGPNAAQILSMGSWSAAARAVCATPGACPRERACNLGVIDATRGPVSKAGYAAAAASCQAYGAPSP